MVNRHSFNLFLTSNFLLVDLLGVAFVVLFDGIVADEDFTFFCELVFSPFQLRHQDFRVVVFLDLLKLWFYRIRIRRSNLLPPI